MRRAQDDPGGRALHWLPYALVVFAVTFVVNVAVVALWPNSPVDWVASAVIAVAVAGTLTAIRGARGRR